MGSGHYFLVVVALSRVFRPEWLLVFVCPRVTLKGKAAPQQNQAAIKPSSLLQPQAVQVSRLLLLHAQAPVDLRHFPAAAFNAASGFCRPARPACTASSRAARYSSRPGKRNAARNCRRESVAAVCSAYCRATAAGTPLSTHACGAAICERRKSVVDGLAAKTWLHRRGSVSQSSNSKAASACSPRHGPRPCGRQRRETEPVDPRRRHARSQDPLDVR